MSFPYLNSLRARRTRFPSRTGELLSPRSPTTSEERLVEVFNADVRQQAIRTEVLTYLLANRLVFCECPLRRLVGRLQQPLFPFEESIDQLPSGQLFETRSRFGYRHSSGLQILYLVAILTQRCIVIRPISEVMNLAANLFFATGRCWQQRMASFLASSAWRVFP